MATWIAKKDSSSQLVKPPTCVAPGVEPAAAAKALGWADGAWRVITEVELAKLQAPTPDELRTEFDSAVTGRLETFARTPYSTTEQPFDSMDRARLSALTADYKQWGDRANTLYDQTWKAAESLVPQVMDGSLTIEAALAKLPALSWT
jgi:hypothetical protein